MYATGAFLSTGSAINVDKVGFKPKSVKLYSVDNASHAVHTDGMKDGECWKSVDSGAGETDLSLVASDGVTLRTNGFQLGTDSNLNPSGGKLIIYECQG